MSTELEAGMILSEIVMTGARIRGRGNVSGDAWQQALYDRAGDNEGGSRLSRGVQPAVTPICTSNTPRVKNTRLILLLVPPPLRFCSSLLLPRPLGALRRFSVHSELVSVCQNVA